VREGAHIARSSIRDGAIIGPGATVRNSVIGSMSEIRSRPDEPTVLEDYVALGDEAVIHPGVRLAGNVSVYPRLKIPGGIRVPPGKELTDAADILDCL
jgi:NDP-sugar pyrophosphorylase family protein